MLASEGTTVPATGKGSIEYVIAAYNNFTTVKIGGSRATGLRLRMGLFRRLSCHQNVRPPGLWGIDFDAAACFAVRTDAWCGVSLRCLSGRTSHCPGDAGKRIRSGQAFVSIRTITPPPSVTAGSTTAATTATSIPPMAPHGWQRRRAEALHLTASSKGRGS